MFKSKLRYLCLALLSISLLLGVHRVSAQEGCVSISADRVPSCFINIPKSLSLVNDKSQFTVKLYGDFSGDSMFDFMLSKEFLMSSTGKDDITINTGIFTDVDYAVDHKVLTETADNSFYKYTINATDLTAATSIENAFTIYCEALPEKSLSAGAWAGNLVIKCVASQTNTFNTVAEVLSLSLMTV